MIKAEELRLGNLIWMDVLNPVNTSIETKVVSVNHILIRDAQVIKDDWTGSPIKLNQEWLERFGFQMMTEKTKLGLPSDYFKYDFVLHAGHHEWWYGWTKGLNVRIDYVHQLQNLYFAIIGKELTIYN